MRLIEILCTLLWCGVQRITTKDCSGIADYDKTISGASRYTTIYDGNYTIQALITLTDETGNCDKVSREGVVRAFAMKYAIDQFNNNSTYSSIATLGLQIDDVCRKLPTTMARGIEVVSFHRENSVCRADFLKCDAKSLTNEVVVKEASAVIGTAMSFTTIPLASLMSLYSIPQVSPSASSRLLSKKDLYKSFFRTIPSDSNQIKAMLDLFKQFDWNYIFAIGSDDDYGKLGVSELKQLASPRNICIYKDEYIPFQSEKTDDKVKSAVEKIKAETKAQVVVLFCYVKGLGDKILKEAKKQGVKRVWLTSESWNPSAAIEFSKHPDLRNQTHGILSVSLKKYPMTYFINYMEKQIRNNWQCNFWLKRYIKGRFGGCIVQNITGNSVDCGSSAAQFTVKDLIQDLKKLPGNIDRLIDATTSLGYAIHRTVRRECGNDAVCYKEKIQTKLITEEMFKTNFTNMQGETVSYDKNGDPKTAFYTIENLVYNETTGQLEYVPVGFWSSGNGLTIYNESQIQWPVWFNDSRLTTATPQKWVPASVPASRCSDRCQPGFHVVGRGRCCWNCHKCTGNNHTSQQMQDDCVPCGKYHYTLDNIKCIETPIVWLEIDDPAGLSIVIISCLGLLGSIATSIFMYKFWPIVTVHEKSPHLLTLVCFLLFLTFAYGPLHIIEPTNLFCSVRNGYFFILLMAYTAFVLTKSQAMCSNLRSYADKFFKGNMTATQMFVLFLFVLLELASIIAWIYLDGKQVKEFRPSGEYIIKKQCEVEFTAARLVSTFIPCIILIIATFCAFRERNHDHSFYEPKFLSFSCIALCIIIVAFLPTFRYVDGVYKAVVLAFTMNVFGYTFVACLILPKVYVGIIRNKRGIQEYPMKAGITKKEKKEEKEKKKQEKKRKKEEESNGKSAIKSSFQTQSTVEEVSEVVSTKVDPEAALESVTVEERPPHNDGEKTVSGYNNETYDEEGEIEVENGSPPPSYESSIQKKQAEFDNTKC